MQLNKNIMFIVLMASSNLACANLEGLISGISCDADFSSRPEAEKGVIRNIGSIFSVNNIDSGVSCKAWAGSDTSGQWFELSSDLELYGVNVPNKQFLGNWPLTTKKQHILNNEQPTSSPSKPEPTNEGMLATAQMWLEEGHENSSGCLSKNPLRYGTVNGDELLFVFFDPSVVVFSPKRGKVDINLLFAQDDVMPDAEYQDYTNRGTFKFSSGPAPQYAALSSIADNREGRIGKDWLYPAQRSYGKVYIDDFNNDQVNDIVMWRKLYFSKLKTDAVNGYELDAEMFAHYAIVDGEYQLQTDTAPETIQGWLTSKNQTWQSGFPSKSECAGQEGQLIPEMHDPLLNDPDVLK
jgi:hypothetical protein